MIGNGQQRSEAMGLVVWDLFWMSFFLAFVYRWLKKDSKK